MTEDIQQSIVIRQTINDELMSLPLNQRSLVILCDIYGFTCKEAAYILDCSSVSVRVRLCQAHKKLRRALSEVAGEVL
jgi:DNA-directed RNA polymerase specialized sigma24 family protein